MQTSLHTSDIQFPIVSRTSLWRMDGKPPFAQDSECSIEKFFPQAQLMGHFEGGQPYLRAKASKGRLVQGKTVLIQRESS